MIRARNHIIILSAPRQGKQKEKKTKHYAIWIITGSDYQEPNCQSVIKQHTLKLFKFVLKYCTENEEKHRVIYCQTVFRGCLKLERYSMDSSMFKKVCCELKSSFLVQYVNEKKNNCDSKQSENFNP